MLKLSALTVEVTDCSISKDGERIRIVDNSGVTILLENEAIKMLAAMAGIFNDMAAETVASQLRSIADGIVAKARDSQQANVF